MAASRPNAGGYFEGIRQRYNARTIQERRCRLA